MNYLVFLKIAREKHRLFSNCKLTVNTYCLLGEWDLDRDLVRDFDLLALLLLLLLLLSFLILFKKEEAADQQHGLTMDIVQT